MPSDIPKPVEDLRKGHAKELSKLTSSQLWVAIMDVLEKMHPMRLAPDRTPIDSATAGHVLYAETQGYERCLRILRDTLVAQPTTKDLGEAPYKPQ